jgi:hypothetical protein
LSTVPKEAADEQERLEIQNHNTLAPMGLNLTTGGLVMAVVQESRDRMSVSAKARIRTAEYETARVAALKAASFKRRGLPTYIRHVPANPTKSSTEGYRVSVHNGHAAKSRLFTSKHMSMQQKLDLAVATRDAWMTGEELDPSLLRDYKAAITASKKEGAVLTWIKRRGADVGSFEVAK